MASCNNKCKCGNDCNRQDDHGGDCDCSSWNDETLCRLQRYEQPIAKSTAMTLYAIKNEKNEWLKSKQIWTTDQSKARIYAKASQAKTQITMLAKLSPLQVPCKLVELTVTQINEIDQTERVKKSLDKAAAAIRRKYAAELLTAQRNFEIAKNRLDEVKYRIERR